MQIEPFVPKTAHFLAETGYNRIADHDLFSFGV